MMTYENAIKLFSYDAMSGDLLWKTPTSNKCKVGQLIKCRRSDGYLVVGYAYKTYLVHRVIWLIKTEAWPINLIDHINLNKSDNRWCNLRQATYGQNHINSKKHINNTSSVKGVSWSNSINRWQIRVGDSSKSSNYIGVTKTLDEAKEMRKIAVNSKFGKFARELL
jgi:hypothetical protein